MATPLPKWNKEFQDQFGKLVADRKVLEQMCEFWHAKIRSSIKMFDDDVIPVIVPEQHTPIIKKIYALRMKAMRKWGVLIHRPRSVF